MKAKILGQNHSVVTYELNGRKRYIVEDIEESLNRSIVNDAVRAVGTREWSAVYNHIEEWVGDDLDEDKALQRCIDKMTYI
jgi:hypothetical protein